MSGNNYSFDDISLPQPPIFVEGQVIEYVTEKVPQYFTSQYLALLDFVSSVQNAFLIDSDQVNSLDADKITNNTQFTQSVFVGAESKIKLDGVTNQITITDRQGSPVTRVILGKISDATDDYGIRVIDAAGVVKFQSGSTTVMDGGIITANTITATQIDADTITATQIAANTITATELAANSVTATEIDVANLSAISADLGTVTAGTLTGGTIRTSASNPKLQLDSSGVYAYKADGTNTAFIGNDGQFRFGTASGDRVEWNNTTLSVTGDIIATGNIQDGAVTVPNVTTATASGNPAGNVDLAVTTRGGNIIGTITVNATVSASGSNDYTETAQLTCTIDGNTFKNTVKVGTSSGDSGATDSPNQFVTGTFLDGDPAGSISSSATTTYTVTVSASADGPEIGSASVSAYTVTLVTLETFK